MKLEAELVSLKADTHFIPPPKGLWDFLLNSSLNWRERKLPTSGRGVSDPLQLKCLAQTGSARAE